jgi:porphyrinogen peroxidase
MAEPPISVDDIQALVLSGFGTLPHGEYLLLSIVDRQACRAWLRELLHSQRVLGADRVGQRAGAQQTETVAVAFSHAGLLALGEQPSSRYPFPAIFSEGMAAPDRVRLLGDASADAWRWCDIERDTDHPAVHLLVVHLAADRAALGTHSPGCLGDAGLAAAFGGHIRRVPSPSHYFEDGGIMKEPFGFRDGLSQPEPVGLHARLECSYQLADPVERRARDLHRVAPGEFVLGLRNEYDDRSYAPDLAGWQGTGRFACHASYLAVRQIRQDVQAFRAFTAAADDTGGADTPAVSLAERMVGRRLDGTPLCAHDPAHPNAFGYRAEDPQGFACPRGAHVRRAHPRDSLGVDAQTGLRTSRLHRLLRRGRSYEEVQGGETEAGTFFIALNGDLERQFAFVQQRWIAHRRFGDLNGEADPLLGTQARVFTVPDPVMGQRVTGLPRFTEVVGGGYFLLPGLQALRYLARADGSPPEPAAAGGAGEPPD